jgi:Uri superfamily endonuclease
MDDLPVQPGTYALILRLPEPQTIAIGRLGRFEFGPGLYFYLGSARGPGGVRARLGRHLRRGERLHWHIDYLVGTAQVPAYAYCLSEGGSVLLDSTECEWSQRLAALPGTVVPVPKFGASDCTSGCPAHLVHFPASEKPQDILEILSYLNDHNQLVIKLYDQPLFRKMSFSHRDIGTM